MSKRKSVARRVQRIEKKCSCLLAEVRLLREALTPKHDEIDEIISHLHNTARRMREDSERERIAVSRFLNR